MFCKKCGNEMPDNSQFCNKCGTSVEEPDMVRAEESEVKSTKTNPISRFIDPITISGIIASLLFLLSDFLPFAKVSLLGTTAEKALLDGLASDGIFVVGLAVLGIIFSILKKPTGITVVGALSAAFSIYEWVSFKSSFDERLRPYITNGAGYYLLMIGAVVILAAGVFGIIWCKSHAVQENPKKSLKKEIAIIAVPIVSVLVLILVGASLTGDKDKSEPDKADSVSETTSHTTKPHKAENTTESKTNELSDADSEDEDILEIKNRYNKNYPDITYGEAFECFFTNTSWSHYTGTVTAYDDNLDLATLENAEVVDFTGTCIYPDSESQALIRFVYNEKKKEYQPLLLCIDDEAQSAKSMADIFNKAFENYIAANKQTESTEPTKTEISLNIPTNVKCTASYKLTWVQTGFEVILTWSKVNGADGYEIYRECFEGGETYTSTETVTECEYSEGTSMTSEYTFKVRAYKNNNGKTIYSDWSEPAYASTGDHLIPSTPNTPLQSDTGVEVFRCNSYGYINAHGGTVAGYDSSYVLNNGPVATVRQSLGDGWHIVAVMECSSHDTYWYNLYDADDGDYYGWVDANYIDFSNE